MLLRATRLVFCAWFAAMAAVLATVWHDGWHVASDIVCFLLVLGHPTLMVIEFALARRVERAAGQPAVALSSLIAAFLREWRMSVVVFGWRLPWRANAWPDHLPASARGRRGVVFVHGFICNRGIWNPWLAQMRRLDRACVAVDLEPVFGSIDAHVANIDDAVRRVRAATGLAPVIVAHSMGGLATRAWLRARRQAGTEADAVSHVLTIGTPHRGTWMARISTAVAGRQMRREGEWLAALRASEPPTLGQRFTCWWSDCDQIVFPSPTAVLPGSAAHVLAGVGHVALVERDEIRAELLRRLDE